VIDEEVGYITALGPEMRLGQRVDSLKGILEEDYDAIFVGTGAPRAAISRSPAARKRRPISISGSTGCRPSPSVTSPKSASA
jgi:hypothetical protein